jgi:predicted Zn-dependent peptidase
VHDLFNLDLFHDHPIGRPICGTAATVNRFSRNDLVQFFRSRYRPRRVIVAAAGHLRHEYIVNEIAARLGSVMDLDEAERLQAGDGNQPPQLRPGVFAHSKTLEQAHLCLGVPGLPQAHPQRYVGYVLNTLLGGGMSSRLFQEIREKRGKAYSVYSFSSAYRDVGYFGVYAGTSVESTEEVVELIMKELKNMADGKISEDELRRTQGQLVGSMILGLESTDSWMSHIARNEIYYGRPISTDDISQGIRAVTRTDVVELARQLFRSGALTVSLLGDFQDNFTLNGLHFGQ